MENNLVCCGHYAHVLQLRKEQQAQKRIVSFFHILPPKDTAQNKVSGWRIDVMFGQFEVVECVCVCVE